MLRNDRGMALIGVIVLSVLLMALAGTFAVAVRSDTQLQGALGSSVTGFYAAESGLNSGMGEYRNIFLGGVDTTVPGDYNGGLENYPRFHEDWGGQALNYQGSFVSLGEPEHVDGDWCGTGGSTTSGCNIYNPPARNWNFDPAFNDVSNLPPLTPRFVYVQQVLFTEDFR